VLPAPGAAGPLDGHTVVESTTGGRQFTAMVRRRGSLAPGPTWTVAEPSMEQLLLAYLRSPEASPLLTPSATPPAPTHLAAKDHAA
jgi:ABC-2 type transport system ATP-binding protein